MKTPARRIAATVTAGAVLCSAIVSRFFTFVLVVLTPVWMPFVILGFAARGSWVVCRRFVGGIGGCMSVRTREGNEDRPKEEYAQS